jgi:hypothetical protein
MLRVNCIKWILQSIIVKAVFYRIMFSGRHDGKVVFAKCAACTFVSTVSLTLWGPIVMGRASNSSSEEVQPSPVVLTVISFNVCSDRIMLNP